MQKKPARKKWQHARISLGYFFCPKFLSHLAWQTSEILVVKKEVAYRCVVVIFFALIFEISLKRIEKKFWMTSRCILKQLDCLLLISMGDRNLKLIIWLLNILIGKYSKIVHLSRLVWHFANALIKHYCRLQKNMSSLPWSLTSLLTCNS